MNLRKRNFQHDDWNAWAEASPAKRIRESDDEHQLVDHIHLDEAARAYVADRAPPPQLPSEPSTGRVTRQTVTEDGYRENVSSDES